MTRNQSLILYPGIHSRTITKQNNELIFCCQAEQEYTIELWSNLTVQKNWIAFQFTRLQDYHLAISTQHLKPGDYEFTLRFKKGNEPWSWYGSPNKNGQVYIVPLLSVTTPVMPQLFLMAEKVIESMHLRCFKAPLIQNAPISLGKIDQDAYVACIKKGSCWLTPIGGMTKFKHDTNQQWQLLLYKEQGNIHLWLPVAQTSEAWLSPGINNTVDFHYSLSKASETHLLIASTTTDNFYHLVETTLNYYKQFIKKQSEKIEYKNIPMLQNLGYCTWNAFGKSIDKEKLFDSLNSLQSNNIPVRYVIIDDGWQETSYERITSMDACKEKFPGGLKETVSEIKSKYPFVESVGVWHALWGYWNGIDETFGKDYDHYSVTDSKKNKIGLIGNPKKFYYEFYSFLSDAGIDFVKVDNQGSFQDLMIKDKISVWDSYRQAMIESAEQFLKGNIVHSMALTPHILLNPILSQNHKSIFRNSDDFFPNEDESHAWHIYANALNTLWKTPALVGDWDMFQSRHLFAEYHATSRAISGGPIYITDIPNEHNIKLIYKLVGQTRHCGYNVLLSKQSPHATFDTVFGNPMEKECVIGLYNLHREKDNELVYGVCGFWNPGPHDLLGVVARSKGLSMAQAIAYVVSGQEKGKLVRLNLGNNDVQSIDITDNNAPCVMSVRVKGFESCLVSISTIQSLGNTSVACLGLIDKFNGTVSISQTILQQCYEAYLTHRSSCCAFWINTKPNQVVLDGQILDPGVNWKWDNNTGLLQLDMMVVPLDITTSDTFCVQIYM
ncbi:hypothetical protein INT48_008196 [Thamnidium elegans]|uniref:Alpha-galactosidase n=1 Tax=Thamnidium elegans TaxID=101142 RepID=A0A8H7SWV5_9FUNG|nr:hypothetical protein INT48_008196 [Thamnidium elegans]